MAIKTDGERIKAGLYDETWLNVYLVKFCTSPQDESFSRGDRCGNFRLAQCTPWPQWRFCTHFPIPQYLVQPDCYPCNASSMKYQSPLGVSWLKIRSWIQPFKAIFSPQYFCHFLQKSIRCKNESTSRCFLFWKRLEILDALALISYLFQNMSVDKLCPY